MRVLFAGTPEVAIPALVALAESEHDLVGVLTRPPAAQGRSKKLVPSPVHTWALAQGIPVLVESPKTEAGRAAIAKYRPDVVAVVAYGELLPQAALALAEYGWINLHFSLLPQYRGAAPVQRAIMAGEAKTGASIFQIVPQLDAGPVFAQTEITLSQESTTAKVFDVLANQGAKLLVEVISQLPNGIAPVPQSEAEISLAPKISVVEAEIDWGMSALELLRLIHGCNPAPGAYSYYGADRFKIWEVAIPKPEEVAQLVTLDIGSIAKTKKSVFVQTGAGWLKLLRVQPLGKKPMAAADWARGIRDNVISLGSEKSATKTGPDESAISMNSAMWHQKSSASSKAVNEPNAPGLEGPLCKRN